MSEFLPSLVSIGQFILGALTAIAATGTFYWLYVRLQAKRLSIVDLATKQVTFWNQALELELKATTDSVKQEEARDRTYVAVQRLRAHADSELEQLSWAEKANQNFFKSGKTLLNWDVPASLGGSRKFDWYMYKFLCWLMLALALPGILIFGVALVSSVPADKGAKVLLAELIDVTYIFAMLFIGRYFGLMAERMGYQDKPAPPLLEKI